MTRVDVLTIVISVIIVTILLVGLYWYRGRGNPLSQVEIDRYIATIEGTDTKSSEADTIYKPSVTFLKTMMANHFIPLIYTASMMRLNILKISRMMVQGVEAFERFSSTMIGLLARRGSHPIFGSTWADNYDDGSWDRIVIVRYRSRRDIADLFASDEFAEASMHKWAAIEENERMLVQGLHIPDLTIPAIMVMAILVELIILISYFLKYRGAI